MQDQTLLHLQFKHNNTRLDKLEKIAKKIRTIEGKERLDRLIEDTAVETLCILNQLNKH